MTAPRLNEFRLVDLVLADQRDMTAVERFSANYDRAPAQTTYRSLIPLSRPGPGEQYAFTVDLDRCSGCKACVSACHSLNGLDENEMWRSVGTIVGDESPYLQTITSSCHHCVDPACAAGCPVLAYEKNPVTGIVHHLDDQCIGCQYCVLKCPYDVPKYSKAKGIVRKCDMCANRLAAGEAPACVQACPHEAIRIEIVDQQAIRTASQEPDARVVPSAFPSSYTLPTTRYTSVRPVPPRAKSGSSAALRLEHAHWPLLLMLLLTQTAVGMHLTTTALLFAGKELPVTTLAIAAAAILNMGLAISVFHLGRPLKAWRAFLGWRRSWMSREILAFSVYAGVALAVIPFAGHKSLWTAATLTGLMGVFCSAMIYVDTQRPGWNQGNVFRAFFGDVLLLGTIGTALFLPNPRFLLVVLVLRTGLFAWSRASRLLALRNSSQALHGFATVAFSLGSRALTGVSLLFLASIVFLAFALMDEAPRRAIWLSFGCASIFLGQLLDRWLFFTATPAPRMPGPVTA